MNTLELAEEHSPPLNNIQSTSNIPENYKIILELIEQMIYQKNIYTSHMSPLHPKKIWQFLGEDLFYIWKELCSGSYQISDTIN